MLKLDLTLKGSLDIKIADQYNKIARQSRGLFTQIVSELSEPVKYNIDWWVESPSSRNSIASPFFHYFCSLNLVDKLVRNNFDISEIIVDSFALKQILRQYFIRNGKSIQVRCNVTRLNYYFRQLIIPLYKIPIEFYQRIYRYQYAKITKYLQRPIPNKALTLIDVYAFHEFKSKDRYYSGLWENLNCSQRECTFFVPTIIMTPRKKLISAYRELRTTKRNFIIKDDYLKISDLFYAIGHYFRLLKIKINPIIFLKIDISSLVKEELRSMIGYSSAVEGLLNYRFAKRIKENKIKLRLVINWFENQVIDKGWNAGFNKFYPDIPTIGYKGYITSAQFLCTNPSTLEDSSGILPSQIAVVGNGLIEPTREFDANLNVGISPAFRFQHVWNKTILNPDPRYFTILVALPMNDNEIVTILKILKDYLKVADMSNLRFWIKIHPATSEKYLKILFEGDWSDDFTIIKDSASKCIPKCNIMISGMSSICLETMSLGIPVIFITNLSGISFSPIPQEIKQILWRKCKTSKDIKDAIEYYRNRPYSEIIKHKAIGLKIKEKYIEPVTKKSVRKFLMLDLPNE